MKKLYFYYFVFTIIQESRIDYFYADKIYSYEYSYNTINKFAKSIAKKSFKRLEKPVKYEALVNIKIYENKQFSHLDCIELDSGEI